MVAAMRGLALLVAASLWAASLWAVGLWATVAPANATDRIITKDEPIAPTDRFAQPAQPAPLEGSPKRFIKGEPTTSAPRLSPVPEGVAPILRPLKLKGHTESPPSTTAPLTTMRAPSHPPPPRGE
jgi:hypothetical protein